MLLSIHCFLFFLLFERLKLFPQLVNFAASLLIIFSPIDMTRMWMLLDPLMMICIQIYTLCFIEFIQRKSYGYLIAGLIIGYGTLLYYEIQLGLLLVIPAIIFLYFRINEKEKLYSSLFAISLGLVYLLFRILGTFFGLSTFHSSNPISVKFLIRQLINGLLNFIDGWSKPIIIDPVIRAVFIISLVICLITLIFFVIKYGFANVSRSENQKNLSILGAGIILWLAGYFPFIAYGLAPYIHWFSSRSNNPIIPGTVILFISILMIIVSLINISEKKKEIFVFLMTIPFIATGILAQMDIQKETNILWKDYRLMWNGIFYDVPDIKENPHIVLVISPYKENLKYGERDFFTAASYNVEISRAFAMFYDNTQIEAEFMYKDKEVKETPVLTKDGIKNPPTYSGLIPYRDILFIAFDRSTGETHVINDLKTELGIENDQYYPDRFIDTNHGKEFNMRKLFQ
jgi:hypothetical protein